MIKKIQRFFEQKIQSINDGATVVSSERALQLATATLLIEVSRADFHIDAKEKQAIATAIQTFFSLSAIETKQIIDLAESEIDDVTCLFEFTRLVNESFDYSQKLKIVEMMWAVSFADMDKDKYEEYLIRKVSELLYVSHSDFIRLRHSIESK